MIHKNALGFVLTLSLLASSAAATTKTPLITDTANGNSTVPFVNAGTAADSTPSTALGFQVNGTEYMRITATGGVGVGTTNPAATGEINGDLKIGTKGRACDASHAGLLQWTGTAFEGCNGNIWMAFTSSPSPASVPETSCKALRDEGITTSDIYWINPHGTPVQVYCDMTTDGGGWTLVRVMAGIGEATYGWPTSPNVKGYYVGANMISGLSYYRIKIVSSTGSVDMKTNNATVLAALSSTSGYNDQSRTVSWTSIALSGTGVLPATRTLNQVSPIVTSYPPYSTGDIALYVDSADTNPTCNSTKCSLVGSIAVSSLTAWVK